MEKGYIYIALVLIAVLLLLYFASKIGIIFISAIIGFIAGFYFSKNFYKKGQDNG